MSGASSVVRPRLWAELALLGAGYGLYTLIRNAAPPHEHAALDRAWHLLAFEHRLHIDAEVTINHAVDSVDWLIVAMNYYYATLHFVVTLSVLTWLYVRHSDHYAAARTILSAATVLALAGYYFFALAPPRLLGAYGFIDTVTQHHTWGSMASGNTATLANQYAAMPSVHITWAVWCGVAVFALARRKWVRVLGACYPLATGMVVVATANHFALDIAGGLAVLVGAYAVQHMTARFGAAARYLQPSRPARIYAHRTVKVDRAMGLDRISGPPSASWTFVTESRSRTRSLGGLRAFRSAAPR
jgi:PAP2 superfamily protein